MPRRNAVVVLGASVVGLVALLVGPAPGSASAQVSALRLHGAGPPGFNWFVAAPPPAAWRSLTLASGAATLYYPPSLHPIHADVGAVSAAERGAHGIFRAYLNATPQQGAENLRTWPEYRLKTLREEAASVAHERAQAVGLVFRGGGVGSCVIDDYTTRVGSNHFREIACFVTGLRGGSVVVAAAPPSQWPRIGLQLERAVAAYLVR